MRRKLYFTPDEWDALPGHVQRMYLDGLLKEHEAQSGDGAKEGMRSVHNTPSFLFAQHGAQTRTVTQ